MAVENDLDSSSVMDTEMNCLETTTHSHHQDVFNGEDLVDDMKKVVNYMEQVRPNQLANVLDNIVLYTFKHLSIDEDSRSKQYSCLTASTNPDARVQEKHIHDTSCNIQSDTSNELQNYTSVARRAQSVNSLDSFSFDWGPLDFTSTEGPLEENTRDDNRSVDDHFLDDIAGLSPDKTFDKALSPLVTQADNERVRDDNCSVVGGDIFAGLSPDETIDKPLSPLFMYGDNEGIIPTLCL